MHLKGLILATAAVVSAPLAAAQSLRATEVAWFDVVELSERQPGSPTAARQSEVTRQLVEQLVLRMPEFDSGDRSRPAVTQMMPIPRSDAYYAEITWEEGDAEQTGIATLGPVSGNPEATFRAQAGGFGLLDLIEDLTADDILSAQSQSREAGTQLATMMFMQDIAAASGRHRVDFNEYVADLADLREDYLQPTDAWGNPWQYSLQGDSYRLVSYGSDGDPGPPPPALWEDAPFEHDLILQDGQFIQAPDYSAQHTDAERLLQRVYGPWTRPTPQARTRAILRNIATATGTMRQDTGSYAANLSDLVKRYLVRPLTADGWGNPLLYTVEGDGYTLISYGCDGAPGPAPPANWAGLPCEPDIIVKDGLFVQVPQIR